jgi:hypothetical protein
MIQIVYFICRSTAQIMTLSAARQLVRCHGIEMTLSHYQSSTIMSYFTDV